MKDYRVVSRKNLPVKFPITSGAVAYLLLDKFNAPGYAWGIVGTLYAILIIGFIVAKTREQDVDIFNPKSNP